MLNVRLNKEEEEKLNAYIQEHNLSKTQVVKEALAMYYSRNEIKNSPYELGKDLFGRAGSGKKDASTTYKQSYKDYLNEKHSH